MFRRFLFIIGLAVGLSGCDLIEYHPYEVRISGETGINAKNMARIEAACAGKDTVRFVMMGDTQRWYDETKAFVNHLNRRTDVDFVIHGGDISDFGLTKEFLWIRDIMGGLRVPYVALLGNHDIIGHGAQVYAEIYGAENFSFVAGNTKFLCLNTNALEYDYSHSVPDLNYIYGHLEDENPAVERVVPVMHIRPGSPEFNNNVSLVFQMVLKMFPEMHFCLHAHNHSLQADDLFDDGVIYYGSSAMRDRNYLYFTLTPDGYEYEVVDY